MATFTSKLLGFVLGMVFFASSSTAFAACHAVLPGGSGARTGTDWNNALAGLPATLVRGDVYYLADGSYGTYNFATPNSGTAVITIRKAIAADHCTDTGWTAGTMGSAQAVFGTGNDSWRSTTSSAGYYVLDGNGSAAAPGCGLVASATNASDCGIKIDASSCTSGTCRPVDLNGGPSNATFRYVEVVGAGAANQGSVDEHDFFLGGPSNTSLAHVYDHDSSCDFWQSYSANGSSITYSYFKANGSSGYCHGQAIWDNRSSNVVISDNVFQDITGTAVITVASAGQPGPSDNWKIFGNAFWVSANPPAGYQCLGNGITSCINSGETCTNWDFSQNTISGFLADNSNGGPAACGAGQAGIYNENPGSSFTVENNLWYNNAAGTDLTWAGATFTEDHNSWLNSPGHSAVRGTGDVNNTASPNPFVNGPAGNFHISAENPNWNNGLTLPSPFSVDASGVARGSDGSWDRGAYQCSLAGLQPPTNLTATVK